MITELLLQAGADPKQPVGILTPPWSRHVRVRPRSPFSRSPAAGSTACAHPGQGDMPTARS
jgi:hypothetical protein